VAVHSTDGLVHRGAAVGGSGLPAGERVV